MLDELEIAVEEWGLQKAARWFAKQALKRHAFDGKNAVVNVLSGHGISGFVFQCPQQEEINLQSDITEYYLENNSNACDHIVRKPITITLNGLQGSYYYDHSTIAQITQLLLTKLPLVRELLPKVQVAKNIVNKYGKYVGVSSGQNLGEKALNWVLERFGLDQLIEEIWDNRDRMPWSQYIREQSGEDLWKLYKSVWNLNNDQTNAYLYFEGLWRLGVSFTVETTWKKFDRMVIKSIRAKRDNNGDITEFTIQCQQINYVNSMVVVNEAETEQGAGRNEAKEEPVSKGSTNGSDESFDDEILSYEEFVNKSIDDGWIF